MKCSVIQNLHKIVLCVLLSWRWSIPTPTLQWILCSRCPYRVSCWLSYNTQEFECRSGLILFTRTSTLTYIHLAISPSHTSLPLFTHTLCVSYPLLLWFLLCGLFLADRLQLDVMAETEAGSWVCRLAFRAPLYGQSPHNTPTHLSHTCRRHSTQRRASTFLQVICYLFVYSQVKKHFWKKKMLKCW